MPAAHSIADVVEILTEIIGQARSGRSRLAYFPVLYRGVTREVQRGIAEDRFADGPRMEQLDVIFANRYFAAYDGWRRGEAVSRCWLLAFGAGARTDCAIIQHLLLGMNAHINLDLAVAAAETAPGPAIHSLQTDFQEINRILAGQINGTQAAIARVAPLMWLLDRVGDGHEDRLVEFSLTKARDASWKLAVALAGMDRAGQAAAIRLADGGVNAIGTGVLNPPGRLLRLATRVIVRFEAPDVVRIIDALQ